MKEIKLWGCPLTYPTTLSSNKMVYLCNYIVTFDYKVCMPLGSFSFYISCLASLYYVEKIKWIIIYYYLYSSLSIFM